MLQPDAGHLPPPACSSACRQTTTPSSHQIACRVSCGRGMGAEPWKGRRSELGLGLVHPFLQVLLQDAPVLHPSRYSIGGRWTRSTFDAVFLLPLVPISLQHHVAHPSKVALAP